MLDRTARRLAEPMKALLVIFAAYTTATLQFIRHAPPSPDLFELTPLIIGLAFVFALFIPVGVLFAIDRIAAAVDSSGRAARYFRIGVLSVCGLLVVRELQLYFGIVEDLWATVDSAPYAVLVVIALLVFAAIAWACARWYEQLEQFCMYLAPVAALMILITMVQMLPERTVPDAYAQVPPDAPTGDGPPVYVVVFDELAYEALAPDGTLDRETYPNFARVADDGVWFDNATTNWFHTTFVLPSLVESLLPVTDEYDVRIYDQYGWVESLYYDGCGTVFTCKGAVQNVEDNPGSLTSDMVLRSIYEVTPEVAEDVIEAPMAAIAGALGTHLPSVDPRGIHALTEEHTEMVLDDIDAESAPGQLTFIHTMLPHTPFIYDREGDVSTDPDGTTSRTAGPKSAEVYASYLRQVQYADTQLGHLLDRLEAEGIYDESVIILTGDHGLRSKGAEPDEPLEIDDQTTQVPFVVKAPGLAPSVSSVDYQHIDFGVTIADVLDIEYDGDSAGVSAFAGDRPDREKVFYVDDDNTIYWTYVYDEGTAQWVLTETVHGPLRNYVEDSVVKAPEDAPGHAD